MMTFNRWMDELDRLHFDCYGEPVGGNNSEDRKRNIKKIKKFELYKRFTPQQVFEILKKEIEKLGGT